MKNTPQECTKTSAFTFGVCHFRFIHFGSAGATRSFPLALGFCKDYFVINDFEKQLISVVNIQCIPHPFCNMDLPIEYLSGTSFPDPSLRSCVEAMRLLLFKGSRVAQVILQHQSMRQHRRAGIDDDYFCQHLDRSEIATIEAVTRR